MNEKLTLIFDIDGTICSVKSKDEKYEDLVPNQEIITKLRQYKANGARIIFFTSRNMNSYNGNIGLINVNTAKILLKWLDKWNIPYDEVIYGKPWPGHKGFYIDDRSVRPDEFLKYNIDELETLCGKSRSKVK